MADQDELYYLQPDFDLSSLTVPRIRNILVAHGVNWPSSAKKQELLNLLRDEVVPQSKKLLSAQARVKRTSRGITDVPSSQEVSDDDNGNYDIDSQRMPPPSAPKTPRSRKSRSNLVEAGEAAGGVTPKTSRKSRTPSGRKSARARQSDTETEVEPITSSARRGYRNVPDVLPTAHSSVKIEEPDITYSRRSMTAGESPFSDDNPFQSGSSPISTTKRLSSGSRSRKSIGDSRRKSSSGRRETLSPEIKREEPDYTRSTYEIPVSRIGIDRNGVEATEEFTSEAEQELKVDLASDKRLARTRDAALTRHKSHGVSSATKSAPFVVLVSIMAALGGWYRQEKIAIGYCGVGDVQWSLASNPNIPVWVHENLQPQCEPCPSHAICYSNMNVQCEDDFILQPHPLNLNGLIPLPPTCEPDSEKERKVKAVADRAVEELREQRATYECGDSQTSSTTSAATTKASSSVDSSLTVTSASTTAKLEIPEESLKQVVSKMRRKGMSAEEFEDLWKGALGDIINREEVEVIRDGSGQLYLSSKSLANLPFGCAIKRSILRTISRYRISIAILTGIACSMLYARHRIIMYSQAKAQVPQLVSMTLDRLATQAALQADSRVQEAFISVGQLRDDVLRHVISARERNRVWQRVSKIVEGNSNVRAATREGGKTGEWSRVWEWIGPVDFAPGLEGHNSFGRSIGDHDTSDQFDTGKTVGSARKWNEGSPIY